MQTHGQIIVGDSIKQLLHSVKRCDEEIEVLKFIGQPYKNNSKKYIPQFKKLIREKKIHKIVYDRSGEKNLKLLSIFTGVEVDMFRIKVNNDTFSTTGKSFKLQASDCDRIFHITRCAKSLRLDLALDGCKPSFIPKLLELCEENENKVKQLSFAVSEKNSVSDNSFDTLRIINKFHCKVLYLNLTKYNGYVPDIFSLARCLRVVSYQKITLRLGYSTAKLALALQFNENCKNIVIFLPSLLYQYILKLLPLWIARDTSRESKHISLNKLRPAKLIRESGRVVLKVLLRWKLVMTIHRGSNMQPETKEKVDFLKKYANLHIKETN